VRILLTEEKLRALLNVGPAPSAGARARELLAKAREMHGLSMEEVACLTFVEDPELLARSSSRRQSSIKEEIYGSRLVFFAPLYISNRCANECTYCAFRATNAA
jgi:2-iminoacetate synthase